jgi:hypothetical protein
LRLSGNTFWLEKADWDDFTKYEETVNNVIGLYPMLAICTYSLQKWYVFSPWQSKWIALESISTRKII